MNILHVASDRSPKRQSSSPVASAASSQSDVAFESETLEELRQYVNTSFHNSESLLTKITRMTLEGQDKDGHVRILFHTTCNRKPYNLTYHIVP